MDMTKRVMTTHLTTALLLGAGSLGLAGCGKGAPPPEAAPPPPPPPPPPEHVPPPEVPEPEPATKILAEVGFETPESVLYDAKNDVYLVSNVNGEPLGVDGNGFISRVKPTGEVLALKFIDGENEGTDLDAPKGMTIAGGTLYVADIDRVRKFDATTGEPKGTIDVKGTTFLNGLSTSTDGKTIYLSDSGLDKAFKPTGTDAIYKLVDDKPVKLIAQKDLGGPNGVLADEGGVWAVTFGSNELFFVNDDGKKAKKSRVTKLPKGGLDGIVRDASGHLFITSWEASSVFRGGPEGEFETAVSGVESPAALGYDPKANRLLIPLFKKNSVVLQLLAPPANPENADDASASEGAPAGAPPNPAPPAMQD